MGPALLLDPITGKPDYEDQEMRNLILSERGVPYSFEENMRRGWRARHGSFMPESIIDRVPDSVAALLEKAALMRPQPGMQELVREPQMAGNFYGAPLYWIIANGTQILNTTTETVMVPSFTLPAGFLIPGSTLRYTVYFDESTVITTPGTITLALRYNGVGGTALATSGAFAPDPTAASTNQTAMVQYLLTCRTIGTAGTVMVIGHVLRGDYDDASATSLKNNLDMTLIPATAPATATVNTTTANTLDPTWKSSVATATTQSTTYLAVLESLV